MSSTAPISATRLSFLALLGGGIMASLFIPFSFFRTGPHHEAVGFSTLALGLIIFIAAKWALSNGIKHNQFANDELKRLRVNTTSTLWTTAHTSLAIIALLFMIVPLLADNLHSLLRFGYGALMLSSFMGLFKASLGKGPEVQPSLPVPSTSLRSDHWGHP